MITKLNPTQITIIKFCAVDKNNSESKASKEVDAKTLNSSVKNSIPLKVEGLHVTNVSPITGYNYLCLLFYTNCESDISKYRVYRSTEPNFILDSTKLIEEIDAHKKFTHVTPHSFAKLERELGDFTMVVYPDESTQLNETYYYKVCAVDEIGQEGLFSDVVSGNTSIRKAKFRRKVFIFSARPS